jgi:hypothetical protein
MVRTYRLLFHPERLARPDPLKAVE